MDKNRLFYGDNLQIMRDNIPDESVDLCYIDPPFNSNAQYNMVYATNNREDKAQALAFVDTWSWGQQAESDYREIMENGRFGMETTALLQGLKQTLGGGNPLLAYLVSMTLRISEIHRVLKPTGSFYLHCDPTASHYLKLLLDTIFIPRGGEMINEIIWSYQGTGESKRAFKRKHDTILMYGKTSKYFFSEDESAEPISDFSKTKYTQEDEKGRYKNIRHSNGKIYKQYMKETMRMRDVWDIPIINASAKERLGYPTQKPLPLLERIIKASSNEGDVVLDAYCGCGTTIAAAEKLNRKWIGIDITYFSIYLIEKRLQDTYKDIADTYELLGIPKDWESAKLLAVRSDKVRKEFEKWAILTYSNNKAQINEKKGADGGLDGRVNILDGDDYKTMLLSVKSGENIGVKDIRDFASAIDTNGAVAGIFLTLYPPTKPMIEWAAQQGQYHNQNMAAPIPKIQIITIQEMLDGTRFNMPLAAEAHKKATVTSTSETLNLF